ncbi:predicted protein [Sclerotinia sclerotiorum 1980 UF-70]|uniref:Uncharacterized protein n=1 Tax=Sclerotinia sclerotiorum (strain ATCC 18683 / 1980 / Ss-1) TaxID=665079 RepID=A7EKK1_SCLS1|nr:predicted protein [Sclerotinia sclerotiorum 1980 UF-70]EDO03367.1 predicted protein [Sclerotinia sclerotiorum 1980 UF-70]
MTCLISKPGFQVLRVSQSVDRVNPMLLMQFSSLDYVSPSVDIACACTCTCLSAFLPALAPIQTPQRFMSPLTES